MSRLFLLLLSIVLFCSHPAFSQEATETKPQNTAITDVKEANKQLSQIEKDLSKETVTTQDTVIYIKNLNEMHDDLNRLKNQGSAQVENIQKKIDTLGNIPQNGENEPADIAKQRKKFTKELDVAKTNTTQTDLAIARIEELNKKILAVRNQELKDRLLDKRKIYWSIDKTWQSIVALSSFLYTLATYPIDWYNLLNSEQKIQLHTDLFTFVYWAIFAFIVALFINWIIRKRFGYDTPVNNPNYSQKVVAAFFMLLARGLIPAAIPAAFIIWRTQNADLFSEQFSLFLDTTAYYLLYLFLFSAIVTVLFTPQRPKWRLIEVNDEKAHSLSGALLFSIFILCVFSFLHVSAIIIEAEEQVIYALKFIENAVKAACIIIVTNRFLYNNTSVTEEELKNDNIQALSTSSKISIFLTLVTLVVFAISFFGYIRLTEYIYNRFLFSVGIAGLCYIFQKLCVVLFHQLMSRRFWTQQLRISKQETNTIEFWFGLILNTIVFMFVILAVLGAWGVSVDIMLQNIKKILTGFNIGDMHVSLGSIFLGIIAFFVTLFVVKLIKNSLLSGKLSKIDMDIGLRNSLVALIGFIGLIIACLLALSIMGGSLKGLAITAGALSLGAGLGLQNVVNNFVSGLILLFERPVKIGDWVIVNGYEGTVKQISLRSTQIETFNKASVIIPNATMLSTNIINMTYKNKTGRIDIPVGVGYDSDVNRVQEILLDIAKNTKSVSSTPAPFVAFKALGESSLDFQLSCYTSDIASNKRVITTTILTNILTRFKEENIDIPYPQRVLHFLQQTQETDTSTEGETQQIQSPLTEVTKESNKKKINPLSKGYHA